MTCWRRARGRQVDLHSGAGPDWHCRMSITGQGKANYQAQRNGSCSQLPPDGFFCD